MPARLFDILAFVLGLNTFGLTYGITFCPKVLVSTFESPPGFIISGSSTFFDALELALASSTLDDMAGPCPLIGPSAPAIGLGGPTSA